MYDSGILYWLSERCLIMNMIQPPTTRQSLTGTEASTRTSGVFNCSNSAIFSGVLGSEPSEPSECAEKILSGEGGRGVKRRYVDRCLLEVLMDFARRVKFDMKMYNATRHDLKPIVQSWHQQSNYTAVRFIEVLHEFMIAYKKCEVPIGQDFESKCAANMEDIPSFARSYDEDTQKVIRLCLTMAKAGTDMRFFMASRAPERQFGIAQRSAHRMLEELCADTVLKLIKRGTRGPKGKASRYQWIAPLGD